MATTTRMMQAPMQGHVLLERALPLSWRVLDNAVADATPASPPNTLLFTLLDTLDESLTPKAEADNAGEMLRIEAKLNVIMHLLGQLLHNKEPLPPAVTLRFSNETLAWQVPRPVPIGTSLHVTLYPDPGIPLGMHFTARVCTQQANWMEVDMHGLSEDELAIWSRWVFRQHRRQIALARQDTAGQPTRK
jgi:hypothetical protein